MVSLSRGGMRGHPPPSNDFFRTPPPSKPMPPHGALAPNLKMKPPHLKNNPPSLKREVPFHELIPRKGAINNNLKSS